MSHSWNITPAEAIILQEKMRRDVRIVPLNMNAIRYVAGADVSCMKRDPWLYASIVVLDMVDMQPVEVATDLRKAVFPYIPGLLSFRESPVILQAWEKLRLKPDALICDGHGVAHPRRFGIASHLGLLLDVPTVGCAKNILVGRYGSLGEGAGSRAYLMDGEDIVGAAVRTRANVKPVIVSPGHLSDIDSSINLVIACLRSYRLPETSRWAHRLANELRTRGLNSPFVPNQEGSA